MAGYRFIELRSEGAGSLYLALVEAKADPAFELRLYFIPEGMACGTRDELIDGGSTWLFLPPEDPEDFKTAELEYAPYPDVPEIMEKDGASGEALSRKLPFSSANSGTCLYGEAADTGAAVIIAEYRRRGAGGREPSRQSPPPRPRGGLDAERRVPGGGGRLRHADAREGLDRAWKSTREGRSSGRLIPPRIGC